MKLLTTITAAAILGLIMTSSVQAAPVDYFKGPVKWAGTGCPAGSSTSVSGAATLSTSFASFDAGSNSLSGLKRSACSFSIPIKVPRGYQVSHLSADWKGFVKGRGQLKRKFFFAGKPYTPWKTSNFVKPNGANFSKQDNFFHSSFATGCNGGLFNLRINSQIKAMDSNSYAAVLSNRLLFVLHFKRC